MLEQNVALKELLKQESYKVETLESGLVNLQQELLNEKRKRRSLPLKLKLIRRS